MSGYIGNVSSVVSSGAERKKIFAITTTTTILTGVVYTPNFVHVFHNGIRLVAVTDYTATNGTSITLVTAAENGDQVVVQSFATFSPADVVSASAGGTFAGDVGFDTNATIGGTLGVTGLTSLGALNTTGNVGIGTTAPTSKIQINAALSATAGVGHLAFGETAAATWNFRTDVGTADLILDRSYGGWQATPVIAFDRSSGNVGIGTSSPDTGLDVNTATTNQVAIFRSGDATATIGFADNSTPLVSNLSRVTMGATGSSMVFNTNSAERLRIDSSGNVLVGKTSSSIATAGVEFGGAGTITSTRAGATLYLNRLTSDGETAQFRRAGTTVGTISVTGSSTAYNTSSDYRLKKDVLPMSGATERVMALKPVNFAWIADDSRVDGFLAHEAQAVVPECATGTKDAMRDEEYEVSPAVLDADGAVVTEAVMGTRSVPDMQGIDQSKLVPILTAALQEALTTIELMEARLVALEVTP